MPERDLGRLLASLEARLEPGRYVFCALGRKERREGLAPLLAFEEPEGTTVVVTSEEAQRRGWAGAFACQWIVLGAASDLEAVGFLAAIAAELAGAGIAVNAVSAFHHDHLFVPDGRGDEVVALLSTLQQRHRAGHEHGA